MAARDFQNEQDYFLSRHRLHNRLLHGWGIVCGLKVTPHPNPDCANRWVVIHPGIAIDCCGRELIIECETPFQLPLSDAPTNCGDDESTAQTGAPSADSEGNYSERPEDDREHEAEHENEVQDSHPRPAGYDHTDRYERLL